MTCPLFTHRAALIALLALSSLAPACYVDVEDEIAFEDDALVLNADIVSAADEEWTVLTWDYTGGDFEIFRDGVLIAAGTDFDGFYSARRRPDALSATFYVCEAERTYGSFSRCSNAATVAYPLAMTSGDKSRSDNSRSDDSQAADGSETADLATGRDLADDGFDAR